MVKKKNNEKASLFEAKEARILSANTPFGLTKERLSAFGGVFALEKCFDAVDFEEIFEKTFAEPERKPKAGCLKMLKGILTLLFIGFSRLNHFRYIQEDPLLCGLFGKEKLPDQSVFWRFLNSMGKEQSESLLSIMKVIRDRVWKQCGISFETIHVDIDTTVKTVYGETEGGRVCYNTHRMGRKGLRPILSFIEETREYVCGNLREGKTVSGEEMSAFVRKLKNYLPACKRAVLRADAEFMSGTVCHTAQEEGFEFIFSNRQCEPPFPKAHWYKTDPQSNVEYNTCEYQPTNWKSPFRFVAMRFPLKDKKGEAKQLPLFAEVGFEYRIFVTNMKGQTHEIVQLYDKRADAENLIGESKREGVDAMPSKKFKNNEVFFQLVLLTMNLWRSLKLFAAKSKTSNARSLLKEPLVSHTARIARLKLLFLSVKIVSHAGREKIQYSAHDHRIAEFKPLLCELDALRKKQKPWKPLPEKIAA